MMKKRCAVVGATGIAGQQFLVALDRHPWFDVVMLAASERSYIQQITAREKSLRCQIDPGPPVAPTPIGPTPGPPTLGSPAPGPTAPGGPGDACKKFPGLC